MKRARVLVGLLAAAGASGSALGEPGRIDPQLQPLVSRVRRVSLMLTDTNGKQHLPGAHAGHRPVVLELFASWSPASIERLRAIADLRTGWGEGVAVYAIACGEAPESVRELAAAQGLPFPVCFDVGDIREFGLWAAGVPATIVLDSRGMQYADLGPGHEGWKRDFPRFVRHAMLGTPREEAERDVSDHAAQERMEALKVPIVQPSMVVPGEFLAVTVDHPSGSVLALTSDAIIRAFDSDFVQAASGVFGEDAGLMIVPVRSGANVGVAGFSAWDQSLVVRAPLDAEVRVLTVPDILHDATPADLDGDGVDELIVGQSGAAGLSAIGLDGQARWTHPELADVWSLDTGDIHPHEGQEIAATHAEPSVRIVGLDGSDLASAAAPFLPTCVRIVPVAGSSGTRALMVAGSEGDRTMLALINIRGQMRWKRSLPWFDADRDTLAVSPSGARYAVLVAASGDVNDSFVIIGDMRTGAPAAVAGAMHGFSIAWRSAAEGERVVIATTDGLYEIAPPSGSGTPE